MSIHLRVVAFYGIKIQTNLGEDGIYELIESVENDEKDVEIIDIDPMGDRLLFLAALDSVQSTSYDDPQLYFCPDDLAHLSTWWDKHIENACEKYQLDHGRPKWFFASYYS